MEEIRGTSLALPLVGQIGAVRSHSARRITWHSHAGFELLFLLDGATAYEFQGKTPIHLPGGHFLVVPPKLVHRGVHNVRMPSTICGIECDPDRPRAQQNTPFTSRDLAWFGSLLKTATLTVRPFSRDLRRTVTRLFDTVTRCANSTPDAVTQIRLRALSCAVLVEAALELSLPRPAGPRELVDSAIQFLEANFQEPVRMADLVKHLGFSRARMFEIFKAQTGMTPNDYLQRFRIRKAQERLGKSDSSTTEVALACGFSTGQYFSQVFRKYTGQTPKAYRAQSGRKKPSNHHRP